MAGVLLAAMLVLAALPRGPGLVLHSILLGAAGAGMLAGMGLAGQYGRKAAVAGQAGALIRFAFYAGLLHGVLILTLHPGPGAGLALLTWVAVPPCVLGLRWLTVLALSPFPVWQVRTLLIGSAGTLGAARAGLAGCPAAGFEVTGSARLADRAAPADDWPQILARYGAEAVALAAEGAEGEAKLLASLAAAGIPVLHFVFMPEPEETQSVRRFWHGGIGPAGRTAKACLDVLLTLSMCAMIFPAGVALLLLVKLDGGPALFRHERIGFRGRTFFCLKFRTMVMDADRMLEELLASDPEVRREWTDTRKIRNDPRITRIGRFLRASSLDELPQLLNVLLGEMSLVGPRPIVPAELPRYGTEAGFYLAAVPGVTGLWQVSGRSDTSYELRVKLDVAYVRSWTMAKDLVILAKTLPAVLLKRGAV